MLDSKFLKTQTESAFTLAHLDFYPSPFGHEHCQHRSEQSSARVPVVLAAFLRSPDNDSARRTV